MILVPKETFTHFLNILSVCPIAKSTWISKIIEKASISVFQKYYYNVILARLKLNLCNLIKKLKKIYRFSAFSNRINS
ncbi:Hypothetical protein CHV_a0214 [Cardinium endosymbiont cBtQ1 of Bemisia tabaci]|nr:Hypothetical protein CHV_a0214 [Cardinium endosymbiont cBtQ1 of Bemisia tabaci]